MRFRNHFSISLGGTYQGHSLELFRLPIKHHGNSDAFDEVILGLYIPGSFLMVRVGLDQKASNEMHY